MEYIGVIEKDFFLENTEQIIIYGAGKVGKQTMRYLKDNGMGGKIQCFIDNNSKVWGQLIEDIPVVGISQAVAEYPQGTFLVASMAVRQMVESLLMFGIEQIHIIREN